VIIYLIGFSPFAVKSLTAAIETVTRWGGIGQGRMRNLEAA
jgi:hypothetical protein